jgi:hypothetical protein
MFSITIPSAKRPAVVASAVLLAATALATMAPAKADRGHWRHGYGGVGIHSGHGGPRVSIHFSSPPHRYWHHPAPRFYYPPPLVYAPPVVVPAPLAWVPPVVHAPRVYVPPTVYVERTDLDGAAVLPAPAPAPAPIATPVPEGTGGHWFFCADSNTYYPYVTQCASPWQRVVPTPPGVSR